MRASKKDDAMKEVGKIRSKLKKLDWENRNAVLSKKAKVQDTSGFKELDTSFDKQAFKVKDDLGYLSYSSLGMWGLLMVSHHLQSIK